VVQLDPPQPTGEIQNDKDNEICEVDIASASSNTRDSCQSDTALVPANIDRWSSQPRR
jgi:hypothetical protein